MIHIFRTSKQIERVNSDINYTRWRWHTGASRKLRSAMVFAHGQNLNPERPECANPIPGLVRYLCPDGYEFFSDIGHAICHYHDLERFDCVIRKQSMDNLMLGGFDVNLIDQANMAVKRVIRQVDIDGVDDQIALPDIIFLHKPDMPTETVDLAGFLSHLGSEYQYRHIDLHICRHQQTTGAPAFIPSSLFSSSSERQALVSFADDNAIRWLDYLKRP